MRALLGVCVVGLALGLAVSAASASGFLVSKIGGDSAGPVSASPSAIYWNPGALGLLSGTQLYIDQNLLVREATYTPSGDAPGGEDGTQASLFSVNSQPMLAVATDAGTTRFRFGLGAYAPFGSGAVWDDPLGPQRFQSIHGQIRGLFVTPTIGATLVEGLHVGFGVSYINVKVASYRGFDFGGLVGEFTGNIVPAGELGNEGRVLLDFEGHATSWTAGATWKIGDWVLGASYTPEIDIELDGALEVYGPRNAFFQSLLGGDLREPGTFTTTWPSIARGAIGWDAGPWGATVSTEWVGWSAYDTVVIDLDNDDVAGLGSLDQVETNHWRDSISVRAGARYRLTPDLTVFGGGGGETTAIPKAHAGADLFDALKFGAALGMTLDLTESLQLGTGYTHIVFLTTDVEGSTQRPSTDGRLTQQVGFLNTNLTWQL